MSYVGMAKLTAVGPSVGDSVPSSELLLVLIDFPLLIDDADGFQGFLLPSP